MSTELSNHFSNLNISIEDKTEEIENLKIENNKKFAQENLKMENNKKFVQENLFIDKKNLDYSKIDFYKLEETVMSLIRCPVSKCIFFEPVIIEDGFVYEKSIIKSMKSSYYGTKSPLTRKIINAEGVNIPLIDELKNDILKHRPDLTDYNFLLSYDFEDNLKFIEQAVINHDYDLLFKFKNYKLDIKIKGYSKSCILEHIFNNLNNRYLNSNTFNKLITYILSNLDEEEKISNKFLSVLVKSCYDLNIIKNIISKNEELINYLAKVDNNQLDNNLLFLNDDLHSPLYYACQYNHPEIIDFLFDASPDKTVNPLMVAVMFTNNKINDNEFIKKYFDKIVIPKNEEDIENIEQEKNKEEILEKIAEYNMKINNFINAFQTIIISSCQYKNSEFTNYLINKIPKEFFKANILEKIIPYADLDILKLVLNKMESTDEVINNTIGKYNWKLIHYAIRYSPYLDVIRYVKESTNTENITTNEGWNPLHIACYYRRPEMIDYMLFSGFDPNIPIVKYKGEERNYLPLNLIELNGNLTEEEKNVFCDLLLQMMNF